MATDYALMSLAPKNPGNFPRPTPDSAGIPKSVQDEMLVAAFNDIDMVESLIEEQKKLQEKTAAAEEKHHAEMAAITSGIESKVAGVLTAEQEKKLAALHAEKAKTAKKEHKDHH